MAAGRPSQFLDPLAAGGTLDDPAFKQKNAVIRAAQAQAEAIHEKLRRIGHDIPKYIFLELIGKGAYGRVFKCHDEENDRVVALKVIDVDTADYNVNARAKDDTIEATIHEIKVLKQLKDSMAKNVNMFFDAFQIHSQLWIVNDYCPGGSVHTLMRATKNKLEEKYILPIARELAEGLKAIHEAGIIHRDVKSANVMIHENGSLQVIDFGVAGILQTKLDKRNTIIGTPHWMPPELHKNLPPGGLNYGTEVDVWAYGCTLIECATGQPPNARVEPGRRLGTIAGRTPPRLNGEQYSAGLRDLVAFSLEGKPADRPTMEQILRQPYIYETETEHPTKVLAELVKTYYRWEFSGGQRQSLFFQGGAAAAEFPQTLSDQDEWNFSTTAGFEQQLAHEKDVPFTPEKDSLNPSFDVHNSAVSADFNAGFHLPAASFESLYFSSEPDNDPPLGSSGTQTYTPSISTELSTYSFSDEQTAKLDDNVSPRTLNISPEDAYRIEERVKRGERAMQGLFDEKKEHYRYEVKDDFERDIAAKRQRGHLTRPGSDLPLRSTNNESAVHREVEYSHGKLQVDSFDMPSIDLANVDTIKAKKLSRRDEENNMADPSKRATKDWTFPSFDIVDTDAVGSTQEPSKRATMAWKFPTTVEEESSLIAPRPRLHHATTAPVGELHHQSIAVLDLDDLYNPAGFTPPARHFSNYSDGDHPNQTPAGEEMDDEFRVETPISSGFSLHSSPPQEEVASSLTEHIVVSQTTTPSRTATSSDEEIMGFDEMNLYDPFLFRHFEEPVPTKDIEEYLASTGVTDPLEIAVLRREIVQRRNGHDRMMKRHLYKNGYKSFLGREIHQPQGVYDISGSDPNASWWSKYDPDINPAPGLFQRRHDTEDEEEDEMMEDRANGILHSQTGQSVLNNLSPPSAESLTLDAPAPIVEAELTRLLTTFHAGLGELLGVFGDSGDDDDDADERSSVQRNGSINGSTNGSTSGSINGHVIGTAGE